MSCSYLLLNGCKLNVQDGDGKTPLHLATEAGHTAQVRKINKPSLADKPLNDPIIYGHCSCPHIGLSFSIIA